MVYEDAAPGANNDTVDDDDDEEFFKKAGGNGGGADVRKLTDVFDRSKFIGEVRKNLELEDPVLRNRFVTGDWSAAADRSAAQPRGDGESGSEEDGEGGDGDGDDEVYGDFEDLETGEKFSGAANGEEDEEDEDDDGGGGEETDEVCPGINCLPRYPTHCEPSCLE